jgi:hypothetical protein
MGKGPLGGTSAALGEESFHLPAFLALARRYTLKPPINCIKASECLVCS